MVMMMAIIIIIMSSVVVASVALDIDVLVDIPGLSVPQ
jgi:hypothetical protein